MNPERPAREDPDALTPPPGAAWVGEWDPEFHDRVFGADPLTVGRAAALLTGIQHRDGTTISGVALRVEGAAIGGGQNEAVAFDMTASEARELAAILLALADRAEALDSGTSTMDP